MHHQRYHPIGVQNLTHQMGRTCVDSIQEYTFPIQGEYRSQNFSELKEMVFNQLTDPKAGMLRRERTPTLNSLENAGQLDMSDNDDKGPCWEHWEEEHIHRYCPNKGKNKDSTNSLAPYYASYLETLTYKGKGKGHVKRKYKGFPLSLRHKLRQR